MLGNYIKIALRNLRLYKGYAAVNILGLAVGLACCIFILLYVRFETSYDNYHEDAERIFRVNLHKQTESRDTRFAGCGDITAGVLRENFSELENVARLSRSRPYTVVYKDKVYFEELLNSADGEIFDIFLMPFVEGDPRTALERPYTAVLTTDMVEKYFGREKPIGKIINVDNRDYEITGIIENPPPNTHWKYGILMSWKSVEDYHELNNIWDGAFACTYIKLRPGVDPQEFERKISRLPHAYIGDELDRKNITLTLFIQPVSSIHLYSNLQWELEAPGNPAYLYIFSITGILILLIACINFMNLTTARSANRASEVGVRKVVGAQRHHLIWQFIGESLIITLFALVAALFLVDIALPFFNFTAGTRFVTADLLKADIGFLIAGLVLATGFLAGIYPAIVLSSFKPVSVMKGALSRGARGAVLRKLLVISQFTISIILIISTFVIYKQLNFMKDFPLGFDTEQKLVVSLDVNSVNADNFRRIKNEYLGSPDISAASMSSSIPGRWNYNWRVWPTGEEVTNNQLMNFVQIDMDYLDSYGLQMAAGRAYGAANEEEPHGYILNEAAVKKFGWSSPEKALEKNLWDEGRPITGVVKDFHFRGLQEEVAPLIMYPIQDDFKYLTLTVNTERLEGTLAFVTETSRRLFPRKPSEFFFLDADFDRQYRTEERISRLFGVFAFLGIFLAMMGLFGLISFIACQRTKEIGIRKVLGASVPQIVRLISGEFVLLVLVANVIALPLALFAARRLLEHFAYRTELTVGVFVLAGALALVVALLTVCLQALKAALANPVKALRNE
ncbi:MAG: ABC transporter permease [Candidatus Zixiibacteriota bacterium]